MMGTSNPCQFPKQFLYGIIFVLFILNGLSAETCRKGCPKSDLEKLKYLPGNVYEYKFDSIITIGVNNNDGDETSLKLTGNANIYAEGNCGYTLKLDKINVQTTRESLHKQLTNGINEPVQFTLTNGELDTKICTDQNDNEYALNIKRSIISLLQSTDINKKYETDIFGICPTLKTIDLTTGNIISTRNLNLCTYRENIVNGLMNGIINEKSNIKSSSYLLGDYIKKQKLINGIYDNIELNEEYKFNPIPDNYDNINNNNNNNNKNIINVNVKTNMKLLTNGPSQKLPQLNKNNIKLNTIIFQHPAPLPIKNLDITKKQLDKTINLLNDYAKSDSANHFNELIRLMRYSDYNTLNELSLHQHQNKNLARKVYFDALFRVGTSESIKSIVKQMPKMNEKEKRYAFISFNLVETVTKDAIVHVSTLLTEKSPREAYLSIGNLVNKYCKNENCDESKEINAISKKFIDNLKECKSNTKIEEDRIIGVLKGIRNTNIIAKSSVQQLIKCVQNDKSNRLRVAALQAFTASSCNENIQNESIKLLKDYNEDSEIRIESYLVLVQCPNINIANQIADIINNEKVNQVGGFITTHLKAIRDSTDFTRESQRYHLSNIRIIKKFPIDPRRYSFNNELSYAIDSLGVGASIDYNLIYSQNGFLPRSGKLNLTSVIFGQSFNTFELNVRQENLENIMEYYFGPKGFLNKEPQEILDQLFETQDVNKERTKRNINDDTLKLSKKYKTYGNHKYNDDINLDLSLKLFGSELTFLSLGNNIPTSAEELTNELTKILMNYKNGLKNYNNLYEYHTMFYDIEYVYPTGIGLPLEIIGQGTTTGKIDLLTEINIDEILDNPKNSKFHIKLIPSMNININGKLRIDGGVLSTGLLIQSNLHSSSGGDIKIDIINDSNGFNIDLNLPRNELKLIELKHNIDFYISENDKEIKLLPFKQNIKKRKPIIQPNCFDQLQIFGLTICYTSHIPELQNNLLYPFNGPIHIDLILQTERNINIKGLYNMYPTHQSWQLLFNTPNSQKSHNTKLQFDLGVTPKLYSRLNFINPEKQFAIESGLQNDNNEFNIYGQLEIDNEITLRKIGFHKNGNEYIPIIQMSDHNGIKNDIGGYKADGKVIVTKLNDNSDKYDFQNFRLIRPNNDATIINGWIINENGFKSILNIQDGTYRYKIDSNCNINSDNGFSIGAFITNDDKPDQTTGGSLLLNFGDKMLKHELKLQSGEHEFNLHNEYNCNTDDDKNEYKNCKFINDLNIKHKNHITISGKLNAELNDKLRLYDIELIRNDKRISYNYKLQYNIKNIGDYDLNINMKLNRHFIDMKLKNDIKNGKNLIDNILITSWGTKLICKGDINQSIKLHDTNINLNGLIQITPKDKEMNWLLKLLNTNDKHKIEFKLTTIPISDNKNDIIQLNIDINKPIDKTTTGNINLKILDLLITKGNFKYNKNGHGDISLLINLIKSKNDIKFDTKFIILSPKYDIDTIIIFNNDKKIQYKTENIIDINKFNTKNLIDIGNDKIEFNANGNIKGNNIIYDSDIDFKFDLKLPTGRKINGNGKRKLSLKQKTGNLDILLQDITPNNKKRSLTIKGQLTDYIPKQKLFNINYNINYIDLNDNTLNIISNIKNLQLNNNYNNGKLSIQLDGTLLTDKIDININLDEYCPEHAIFNINNKYGNKLNLIINGNYQLMTNNKPFKYDIKTILNIPNNQYKNYIIESNGKYKQPINDNDIYDIDLNILYKYDNNELKLNSYIKGNNINGEYMIETNCPWHNTIKLNGNYLQNINNDNGKYQYNIKYNFNNNINIDTEFNLNYQLNNLINLNYKLLTNYDNIKNIEIIFNCNHNIDINQYKTITQFNLNNNIYKLNTIIDLNDIKNGINLIYESPNINSKLNGLIEYKNHNNIFIIFDLDNFFNIDLISKTELNYQQIDDFYIKIDINSIKLNLNKLHIDINTIKSNNDQQNSKSIQFNINNSNENILNGLAQFNIKNEKYKNIIEGQGTIKYYNNDYNVNIKLINQLYNMINDNENGFSYNFIGKFGPKNIISTIKMTTKNFHIKLAACEDKKQCTHFEIESVTTSDKNDLTQGQHKLLILINLLELGYPYEFELTSKTTYKGYKILHEIDMNIISNNNNKYEFSANLQLNHCLIKFKLPKRSIVFEIVNSLPKNNHIFGKYENSITFYFDKDNKPNDKTQLLFINNIGGIKNNAINTNFIIEFQHPTIRKLSINGKIELNQNDHLAHSYIEFDIFKQAQSKIIGDMKLIGNNLNNNGYNLTTESQLFSDGLGFKYLTNSHLSILFDKNELTTGTNIESIGTDMKFSTYLLANRNKFDLLINGFNYEIIKLNCQLNYPSHKIKIINKLHLFNTKPIEMLCELEPRGGKFIIKRNGMFDATGEIKIGKDATFIVNGYGKKLYNGKIMLDTANLLTTTYEVEDDNIRTFLHDAENEYSNDRKHAIEEIDKQFRKLSDVIVQRIQGAKQSVPDFTKLRTNYENNLNAIVKELEEDPALKKIIDIYRQGYEIFVKFMTDFVKKMTELYEDLQKSVTEFYENISKTITDQIIPIAKEFLSKLTEIFSDLYMETMKIIGTIFERALKSLQGFKEYLINLSKPFGELLKPIADMLNELFKNISKEWNELWKDIDEYWNKMPSIKDIFNNVYNKLIKLHNIDELLNILREIFNHLEQWTLSKEGQEFLNKLYKYIENKLRNENINDIQAIEELYYSFINAIQSIIKTLSDNLIDTSITSPLSYLLQPLPFTYDTLIKLPTWIEFKFSPFNYLRNEKFNIFKQLLLYRIPTLDILPPYELYGHIADGQHIFTFDGKHLTYPGNCKYILAQDYINNNFSVVANLNNGKMKSIILIDKNNYIEINDKSQIYLNGKLNEYPIHNNDIHAWRRYYTVSILSEYGVKVMCSSDLRVCHVIVNGFYTGKIRGLLGNGNAEQYDDFTKPDGNIIDNYAEFGNSYGLGNCQPVISNPQLLINDNNNENIQHHQEHNHDHHNNNNNEICNELFNYDSNFIFGYLFIDPIKYREACNHAVLLTTTKNNQLDAACNIALTYASAARIQELPVYIPDQCIQCKLNDKYINFGDEFKSHIPNNQVDLVFIIDTSLDKNILSQLVQNILKDIRDQLKQRGMTNINLAVIGYNDKHIYPQLYTTGGKYNNFNGDTLLNMNMNGPEHEQISNLGSDKINDLLTKLQSFRDLLQETGAEALELALEYPFRSGAAKSIIVINNDTYKDFGSLINDFGATVSSYMVQNKGLSFHYIGNINELSVEGGQIQTDKIVGFNKRAILTLDTKDTKKRTKLHYESNMAIELIQENYGWVFALQNFNQLKTPENKLKFTQRITSSIADQLFKTTIDYNCKCTAAYGLHAEEDCSAVSTSFDANKKLPK